jgi:hypothetical protein
MLTPALSKVPENVIGNQLIVSLNKHNIFNKSQLGSRKNKSTNGTIVTIIENIIDNLNNNIKCNCVLLNLSKPFDCIKHNILIDKLHNYGVRGVPHKLSKSYLTNRIHHVKVTHIENNQMKEYLSNSLPVPQGSVLVPSLSILYINDIPHLTQGRAIIYDVTSILNTGQDINELQNITSDNIRIVEQYFKMNNL